MEKTYNMTKLLWCDEFDVQKCSAQYDTKEDYFAVLSRFTAESEAIMNRWNPDEITSVNPDIALLTDDIEKLKRLLANMGAVRLVWSIQGLSIHLKTNNYRGYASKLRKIFSDVDRLRKKIISAENTDCESIPRGTKAYIKTRREMFERLLTLIDNREYDSAAQITGSIMKHSYMPETDELLGVVGESLGKLDYTKALETARKLLELIDSMDEIEEPERKRILAIDDMPDVLRTVKAMLKDKYTVYCMTGFNSAAKFFSENTVDLILLDIEMPGLDGFDMLQMFRNIPGCEDIPVVFLSSNVSAENIRTALSLGACDFIKKPVDVAVLTEKLEKAFLNRQTGLITSNESKFNILIVDDDQANFHVLFKTFKNEYMISVANSGKSAIEQVRVGKPDLILLDIMLPDMSGYDVLSKLKESDETRDIPIIFITGLTTANDEAKGLFLGAVDYITKPLNVEIVRARVKIHLQIVKQMRMIERLGMIDALTDMPNRRRFDQQMEIEWARAIRENTDVSLLMLDVDYFKAFNDKYGHSMGDSLLQALAKTFMACAKRPADLAARIGGEEFAVLLPATDLSGAVIVGEKIRASVEAFAIPSGINPDLPVTISVGVASIIPDKDSSISDFIALCDKNLYTAKEDGRNTLCCKDISHGGESVLIHTI